MSKDFGQGVSHVYDEEGYNYDTVVFQKEKPPLDSELNLVQQIQSKLNQRHTSFMPSGWLSSYPTKTDPSLENSFYTQSTSNPRPEYALVNGHVVHVTKTGTNTANLNLIDLGDPPTTGNRVNGVFLEVWRALLDPDTSENKPDPAAVVDAHNALFMWNANTGWVAGGNGLILKTENGGQTWGPQDSGIKQKLFGIHFVSSGIGWAVGDNGSIIRTASGGVRWTSLSSPTSEHLKSVYGGSQMVAWAVGDSGTILKTSNGITWMPMSSGTTSNLRKVYFHDTLVGWTVGEGGIILKTTDGGTTWNIQTSGVTEDLNSIYFYDLNYGFAVGDNGTILRTSDGGGSWVNQSGNVFDGSSYYRLTQNLNDVTMVPGFDVLITNEEVSHQFDGVTKTCTVSQTPITKGDGKGTVTNVPGDVTVTVNGNPVAVDAINGATGTITLSSAPKVNDTVLVTYYYLDDCAVFKGRAWIVGDSGKVVRTDNIGAQWTEQNSQTAYNLNAVDFISQEKGWSVGDNSVIRYTENAGSTWVEQQPETLVRIVQRVYFEGNTGTTTFLDDNAIHPDANIETTKRIQVQYKIRVIEGADPTSNPEAGLSAAVLGIGPNTEGQFSYENMGPINGDYGLWRAKCNNTVDGYCWAVPMFFVNRRNTATYNPASNANGSNQKNTSNIRPDLLVAERVADGDILDVRRRISIPSVNELLSRSFDLLSSNDLRTRLGRDSVGGDRYGTQLLQVDQVGGTTSDGGNILGGRTLLEAVNGDINSEVQATDISVTVPASIVSLPGPQTLGPVTGLFQSDPSYYQAVYVAPGASIDGKPVPGEWSGIGTQSVTFSFRETAKTKADVAQLTDYVISSVWLDPSAQGLEYIPSEPQLVKNYVSGSGDPAFFYHGVLNTDSDRTVESWASGLGYDNYSLAYPNNGVDSQQYIASPVELHHYVRLDSSNIDATNNNILSIPQNIYPDQQDVPYSILTVSHINNIDSGFSYKIQNMWVDSSAAAIKVQSVSGFPFVEGSVAEIVSRVQSDTGSANVRNGAAVSMTPSNKGIEEFTRSVVVDTTEIAGPVSSVGVTVSDTEILGISSTETVDSTTDQFCWVDAGLGYVMTPLSGVTGFGTDTITLSFDSALVASSLRMQLWVKQNSLIYQTGNAGLLIGYNYTPYQSAVSLPASLTVEVVDTPSFVYISNLGTGGGADGVPYSNPIDHIPVNDVTITSEGRFANIDSLKFSNFSVDTGFVRMPAYIPASFGETITLSGSGIDDMQRHYYSQVSKPVSFVTEGLQRGVSRKVYVPLIVRVRDRNSSRFMNGEYLMIIMSRTLAAETENVVGTGSNNVIAVYRIPNKPLSKV